jgi:hypothetical protein
VRPGDPGSPSPAERVLAHCLASPPTLGGGRLLCLDGPSGAGKTTLAREVVRAARRQPAIGTVRRVCLDDLYPGWEGLAAGVAMVANELLPPLAQRRPGRYRRWDWQRGRPGVLVTVDPVDLLVLEGCGAGSQAYQRLVTTLVWLEADEPLALGRAVARDGPDMQRHLEDWQVRQRAHFARERPWERADLVLRLGHDSDGSGATEPVKGEDRLRSRRS